MPAADPETLFGDNVRVGQLPELLYLRMVHVRRLPHDITRHDLARSNPVFVEPLDQLAFRELIAVDDEREPEPRGIRQNGLW